MTIEKIKTEAPTVIRALQMYRKELNTQIEEEKYGLNRTFVLAAIQEERLSVDRLADWHRELAGVTVESSGNMYEAKEELNNI
jgi:hypothetical protein